MKWFGARLKHLREQKEKTQREMADMLGIKMPAYANYEADRREPSLDSLKKIAEFLGVSVDFLLGISNSIEISEPLSELPDSFNTNYDSLDVFDIIKLQRTKVSHLEQKLIRTLNEIKKLNADLLDMEQSLTQNNHTGIRD